MKNGIISRFGIMNNALVKLAAILNFEPFDDEWTILNISKYLPSPKNM